MRNRPYRPDRGPTRKMRTRCGERISKKQNKYNAVRVTTRVLTNVGSTAHARSTVYRSDRPDGLSDRRAVLRDEHILNKKKDHSAVSVTMRVY